MSMMGCQNLLVLQVIVISLPERWSFYTVTPVHVQKPHPREGYNYYITCYLGNITVEEKTFLDVA